MGDNLSRLVAEIAETTSPDADLYIAQKNSDDILFSSTNSGGEEYCEITSPPAGTYRVIVPNYEATDPTGAIPDSVELVGAEGPDTDAGNLKVIARTKGASRLTAVPGEEDFDLLRI